MSFVGKSVGSTRPGVTAASLILRPGCASAPQLGGSQKRCTLMRSPKRNVLN